MMASSTTSPIASTRPNSDSVLMENPSTGNIMNVPISETGTAINGISVGAPALQENVDHQDHQQQRDPERQDDLVNAGGNGLGGVERNVVLHAGRKVAARVASGAC